MGTTEIPPIEQAISHADRLLALHGVPKAARMLGVTGDTLARLHGRLPVHAGTIAKVIAHLRESTSSDRAEGVDS